VISTLALHSGCSICEAISSVPTGQKAGLSQEQVWKLSKRSLGSEVLTAVTMKGRVLGFVTSCSSESPAFRRNMSPQSSGSKSKPSTKPVGTACYLVKDYAFGHYSHSNWNTQICVVGSQTHTVGLFLIERYLILSPKKDNKKERAETSSGREYSGDQAIRNSIIITRKIGQNKSVIISNYTITNFLDIIRQDFI
jgi:hypothetical protein